MTCASSSNELRAGGGGDPLVSVVIPHYNRATRLLKTLDTVKTQTFSDWEIIIVDDASTDDLSTTILPELADKRIRLVVLEKNAGPAAARNAGIARARGRFVAFLDSDDLWSDGKLEAQVKAILTSGQPDRVICTTQILKLGPGDLRELAPLRPVAAGEGFGQYMFVNGGLTQTSSVMLGTEAAREIGFDAKLRQFEDYLFFLKAGAHGLQHILVAEPLVTWFNDNRINRLSRGAHNNVDNLRRFLAETRDMLDDRTRLSFLTRHAGRVYVRDTPIRGLYDLARSASQRLISWRFAASIAANALAPISWMTRFRDFRGVERPQADGS